MTREERNLTIDAILLKIQYRKISRVDAINQITTLFQGDAIAEHSAIQWKKYPANVPEVGHPEEPDSVLYWVTYKNSAWVDLINWDEESWNDVIAFTKYKAPEPYKPEWDGKETDNKKQIIWTWFYGWREMYNQDKRKRTRYDYGN